MSTTQQMLDDRDYGLPDTVMASGDLEYRFDYEEPDWEDGRLTTHELGDLLLQFEEWGRKRNPKKEKLRELLNSSEWHHTDVYCAIRAILHSRFPHPGIEYDVDANAVYDALGNVFGDGTRESGKQWKTSDEYSDTVEGLREDNIVHPPEAEPESIPLKVLFGKWLYALAEEDGTRNQQRLIEEMLKRTDQPWVVVEALFQNVTMYFGSRNMVKVIRDEFAVDDPWRCWRTTGDTATFYLEALRGKTDPDLHPHDPHNSMKANSTDASAVAEYDEQDWLAQYKYDGARLFIHHAGDGDIRAYSSGKKDVTAALPELDSIDWPDYEFIFDAEATPYDEDGNVVPFEKVMTRLTRKGVSEMDADDFTYTVVLKIFDCPVFHGRDITERAYTDRFSIVQKTFEPVNVARTGEDLEVTFHRALEGGHEGLVLKQKDGEYMPGGRHSQWQKWKPEPETIEARVVDVHQGGGRLDDRMGALSLALKGPDEEDIRVGRVGTGFSDEERMEWWVEYETGDATGQVIEIEYEDLQYDTGWGLRFPRYRRRRPDGEVDTVKRAARLQGRDDEYEEWHEAEVGKKAATDGGRVLDAGDTPSFITGGPKKRHHD